MAERSIGAYVCRKRLARGTAAGLAIQFIAAIFSVANASIDVGPPIPVAGQSFAVSRAGLAYGPPLTVVETAVTVGQQTIDLVTYVDHGSSQEFPSPYLSAGSIPGLAAGDYLVRVFRRDRTSSSVTWGEPIFLESAPISVVAPSNVVDAIEYFSVSRDHYFLTIDPDEMGALDAGALPDWQRTGRSIPVHARAPANPNSVQPVCRYYGLPYAGLDTHFFSAFPPECAHVVQAWPDQWILESQNAFHAFLPKTTNGECPNGTQPIYRFYNGRPDVNHRYTTSIAVAQDMSARGWIAEGWGPASVAMCSAN